ncbi:MAG: hypothetical protein HQL26_02405 [Candidatus Omnitrophica bacterium]|nr:hypothetical protein [Candidatus Omnitrophota bacterium]
MHFKKFLPVLTFLFTLCFSPTVNAENIIHLKDGSNIKGQVTSLNNGLYTIKTETLGNLTIKAEDVANINNPAIPQTKPAETNPQVLQNQMNAASPDIKAMQNKILADPNMMQQVQGLINDKEIMNIIQDPEFMKAIMSQNVEAIKDNPKTEELLKNPNMQKMLQQMGAHPNSELKIKN